MRSREPSLRVFRVKLQTPRAKGVPARLAEIHSSSSVRSWSWSRLLRHFNIEVVLPDRFGFGLPGAVVDEAKACGAGVVGSEGEDVPGCSAGAEHAAIGIVLGDALFKGEDTVLAGGVGKPPRVAGAAGAAQADCQRSIHLDGGRLPAG